MEGMLSAEETCCRSKQGYAWSLKLVRAVKLVWYWKLRKSSLKNRAEYEHLHMLAALLEVEDYASQTMSEINKRLTDTRKALKLVQKNVAVARDIHLEELARHQTKHSSKHSKT
eukprot:10937809-Ditylum_brightwellii.AAC.1